MHKRILLAVLVALISLVLVVGPALAASPNADQGLTKAAAKSGGKAQPPACSQLCG
jgi:hypothetical protein